MIYAYYGVSCANGNLQKKNQQFSTNWAGRLCNGKTKCSGRVSHLRIAFMDPYYGCQKDFIVVAKCSNGKIIADLVKRPAEASGRRFYLDC